MDTVSCGHIDSTSSHAAALIQQGRKPPFAVWATSQSQGRGRRGHSWVSPEGNMYLTVALPPEWAVFHDGRGVMGCLPLKAAVLIARVIQKNTGLRPTLKWPNDLLVGGRKLGGLLLEMSSAGGQPSEILIGVGLNLNVAPTLDGPYQATSLATLLKKPQNVAFWVQEIVKALSDDWRDLPLAQVPQAFESYAIAKGALWHDLATEELYRSTGIGADGSMTLESLSDHKERTLTSVDHGLSWLYLGQKKAPLVVADVGNSRLKIGVYEDMWVEGTGSLVDLPVDADESGLSRALDQIQKAWLLPPHWPLHLLSVNPAGAGALMDAARKSRWTPLTITKKPIRRWGQGYDLETLGIDRLALMEGFLARQSQRNLGKGHDYGILLSLGTATTLDVVASSGEHLGGWILPGLKTSLKSLRQSTQLLPLLEPSPQGSLDFGHDTSQAMEQGVLNMTLGAIQQARSLLREKDRSAPWLVITGGFAPLLAPHIESQWMPDLVMEGARQLVLGGA